MTRERMDWRINYERRGAGIQLPLRELEQNHGDEAITGAYKHTYDSKYTQF